MPYQHSARLETGDHHVKQKESYQLGRLSHDAQLSTIKLSATASISDSEHCRRSRGQQVRGLESAADSMVRLTLVRLLQVSGKHECARIMSDAY